MILAWVIAYLTSIVGVGFFDWAIEPVTLGFGNTLQMATGIIALMMLSHLVKDIWEEMNR